jgi:hypothetical protein
MPRGREPVTEGSPESARCAQNETAQRPSLCESSLRNRRWGS